MEIIKNGFKPIKVSEIVPVFNDKGGLKEWRLTVLFEKIIPFEKTNNEPPHARGARDISVKLSQNRIEAEYRFPESVMKRGAEHALRFKTQLLFQMGKDENIK